MASFSEGKGGRVENSGDQTMCRRCAACRGDKQKIAETFNVKEVPDFAVPDADYNITPTTALPHPDDETFAAGDLVELGDCTAIRMLREDPLSSAGPSRLEAARVFASVC
jgi:hypothetical protein